MTTAQRILRTLIQVLVAVGLAIPGAAALIPGLDIALAAKVGGVAGALVLIVTAVQNALEDAGVLPAVAKQADHVIHVEAVRVEPADPREAPVDVAPRRARRRGGGGG